MENLGNCLNLHEGASQKMPVSTPLMFTLPLAVLVGYVLGSIPVAALVSRRRGVDIFTAGTGLAGAANVFRNVGRFHGTFVFWGDATKGVFAVVAAHRLGLQGEIVLLPAMAALAGHWRSVFTRFRGGDGLSTLLGITIAMFPVWGILTIVTGGLVALIARGMGHHPTLWGGTAGYSFLLLRAPMSGENIVVIIGVVAMAIVVLTHGVIGHRRRAASA